VTKMAKKITLSPTAFQRMLKQVLNTEHDSTVDFPLWDTNNAQGLPSVQQLEATCVSMKGLKLAVVGNCPGNALTYFSPSASPFSGLPLPAKKEAEVHTSSIVHILYAFQLFFSCDIFETMSDGDLKKIEPYLRWLYFMIMDVVHTFPGRKLADQYIRATHGAEIAARVEVEARGQVDALLPESIDKIVKKVQTKKHELAIAHASRSSGPGKTRTQAPGAGSDR
jgi:hypothetical protein